MYNTRAKDETPERSKLARVKISSIDSEGKLSSLVPVELILPGIDAYENLSWNGELEELIFEYKHLDWILVSIEYPVVGVEPNYSWRDK